MLRTLLLAAAAFLSASALAADPHVSGVRGRCALLRNGATLATFTLPYRHPASHFGGFILTRFALTPSAQIIVGGEEIGPISELSIQRSDAASVSARVEVPTAVFVTGAPFRLSLSLESSATDRQRVDCTIQGQGH